MPLADALHRVPAADVPATAPLPGFARSTVDGYAVRAADTYGASEGLPSYLDLLGAVRMGAEPTVAVRPGGAVGMPTGGVLPEGADAVVMVEHTAETMPGTIEVTRPVAPGSGIVRADEDVAAGAALVPGGRPLRAPDLGLLAAAGVTTLAVHARPRVVILSTGDEVVPPHTAHLRPGQVRDATASALAGLVRDAGGDPVLGGIVSDEPGALETRLREVLDGADLVVVSAGSSVGARDETAGAVAALGDVWCHGLAIKPGKPTLLAECAGVPVVGLPGNPLSGTRRVPAGRGAPGVAAGRLRHPAPGALDPRPPRPRPAVGRRTAGRRAGRGAGRDRRAHLRPVCAAIRAHPRRRLPRRAGTRHRPGRGHRGRSDPLPLTGGTDRLTALPIPRTRGRPRPRRRGRLL